MDRKYKKMIVRAALPALFAGALTLLAACGGGGGGGGPATLPVPSAFSLLGPADGASNVDLVPSLSWVDSAGETSYTLQISTSPTFAAPLIYERTDLTENTTAFTVSAGVLAVNTTYYWRLLAANAQGSTASSSFSFTTKNTSPDPFQLVSPADAAQDVSLTPTLAWTDAIGASLYTIELSMDAGFADSTVSSVTPTNTNIALSSSLQEWTTYYWRVGAVNPAGTTTAANAPFSFKTRKNGAPNAFDLTAPANNAAAESLTPDLTWTAAFGVTTYTVQIATDAAFTAGLVTYANLSSSTGHFQVPAGILAETTTYFWRVLATNVSGATSSNGTFSFTTARITAPSAFTLLSPANAATGVLFPVTLSWSNAAGENSYTVQISIDNFVGAPHVYDSAAIPADSTNHSVASGILNAGTTYYWRVIATNAIGSTITTDASFNFSTKGSGERVWAQTIEPTAAWDDEIYGVAVNGAALYAVGFDSNTAPTFDDQWRIEKRGLGDGSLVTSFGTAGVVVSNPSGTTINSYDDANAIAIDSTFMYVVGFDSVPDVTSGAISWTDDEWRIEKRWLDTGALDNSFGPFVSAGTVVSNPSSSKDEANAIAIDSLYMYIAGNDTTATRGTEWRIEKRLLSTGESVTGFNANGVVTSDPSPQTDNAKAIAIDETYMYVAGHESSGSGLFQWRIEKRRLDTGDFDTLFGASGVVTVPTVTGDSSISAVAVDAQYLYIAGYVTITPGNTAWTIEKRDKSNGTLVYSMTSNPNPSGNNAPKAMVIDAAYVYVAGYDTAAIQKEWRIEKRNLSDASLVTSFGLNGVYQSHPSAASSLDDDVWAMASDADYLYVAGYDSVFGTREWRVEKIVK